MIPNAVYCCFLFSASLPHLSHWCTQTITTHRRILPWLGRYVVKNLVVSIFTISELIFYSYSSFYNFSVIRGGNSIPFFSHFNLDILHSGWKILQHVSTQTCQDYLCGVENTFNLFLLFPLFLCCFYCFY